MPAVGAALLVGLLPAQSLAVPPDPSTEEKGRATLQLEALDQDKPLTGTVFERDLESLKVEVPADLEQAPAGTATAPLAASGLVTFGSAAATSRAAAPSGTDAQQADLVPVEDLPVSIGRADDQPAPTGTWQVSVADRTAPVAQGVDGALITIQAPATGSVPVSVELDYAKFKNLYGADWASRLRFVQFPECYLVTPEDEACQTYEELETVNDTTNESITATVDTAADGIVTSSAAKQSGITGTSVTQAARRISAAGAAAGGDTAVIGAVDSGGGPGGTFKATPLASSGSWQAGGSSGAFTWSYPLNVPAAPAGPAPQVAFSYSSQSVDGRVAVSSPQASWIGEGWDYDPGHIERRYRSCQDDRKALEAGTPNNTAKAVKTSDLCWVSYNAVMSLGGKTVELVRDAPAGSDPETDTEIYRAQTDDGTRIERRTGGANGDNNGEYWIVTTTDGTKYYFGLNEVGGGHSDTQSVSTVPVFGNHPGEPCHADTFAASRCGAGKQQAWRWGLDKVVDVHGNVMVVNWKQETNHYAVRKKFTSPEQYERAAYPTTIEYGMRSSDLTKPSATVEFGAKQRCLKSETACDAANFAKTDDPGAYRPWWDTPGNLNCKSTSKLCPAFPSFWTQMRLDTVTTKAARAGQTGLGKVDTYQLHQSFPEDWYDTAPGLWLNSITRRGFAPGDNTGILQHKDGVSFAEYSVGPTSPLRARLKDRQLPNLVPSGPNDQRPAFTRPRIGTVATEYGGDIEVEYMGGCATEPADDKGKDNGTCYPVRWSPDGDEKTPAKAWFNKYVVHSVTETDKVTSHGKPVHTTYKYTDPAWAKSDDEFIRPSLRTFSIWRGYRQVAVTKGSALTSQSGVVQSQSYAETRYFQGTGGQVKDSTGKYTLVTDDAPQYAGMTAESITYLDSGKRVQKRVLSFPWSKQTASRPREAENGTALDPLLAHRTGTRRSDEIQTVDTSWRAVRTLTTVDDTYGLPVEVETSVVKPNGSGETLSDQKCTKTSYVHNTTTWLIGLTKEQRTTGTSCTDYNTADPGSELVTAVRNSYDNLAYGATPAKGLLTSQADVDGTGTSYSVVTSTTYDPLGRVRTVTSPGAGTTETQYTPGDAGGPVTAIKVINAKDHAITTAFDPGRGLPLTVTDANGRVTRNEYDALGRLVKGWSPSRSSGGKSPDVEISYQSAIATADTTRPAAVTTKNLKDDGTYSRQVAIYDGLMRPVQTQSEAHGPGRVVTDTRYNDHGLVDEQTSGYLAKGDPAAELFAPRSRSLIPSWIKYRYDGLERKQRESAYHDGDFVYATYTYYSDTSTYVDPPGATAPRTRTFTDALGRVTSIRHYKDDGSTSEGRVTSYEYDARGYRTKVTDPAGNAWTYTYDARGRVTSSTDPDTGETKTWYDEADRPVKVTDSESRTTYTEYDELGRVKTVRENSSTAVPAKEFTYDSLPGALGQPVASIRHTPNGDFIDRVTGYDTEYRPTGRETVIPPSTLTTGLAGTYAYAYTYTPVSGQIQSAMLPAVGGLAQEKVITRYNSDDLAESTSGLAWYTSDVTYSPYGEALRTVSGAQPYRVWTTNFIDPHTGRLQRTVADRETSGPHRLSDGYYAYDKSGSITSHARLLTEASGSTWDTQCFTYDVMGELLNAWTSSVAPTGANDGCTASNGTTWGHRTDYMATSGPVADAPDAATDVSSPDSALASTRAATAPDPATVSVGGTSYRQSFTFDWLGNRAAMTEHDPADSTKDVTFRYGHSTPQPHTVKWISSDPSGKGSSYTYDATGNTTVRDLAATTQNLTWTHENKLDTITDDGKKTTYVYDASGIRVLESSPSGSTLYLGETEVTTDAAGAVIRASRTYAQVGAPSVTRTANNGSTTGHQLSVLLSDHLGTADTAVSLSSGQAVTRQAFKPYGEIRGTKPTVWPNKRSYLGVGIDDSATGLTHIGAREYDQASGRFLSADPVIDIADPLQMNGYAYSGNSPVTHSDPTGLFCDGCSANNPDTVWTPDNGPGCTTSACYDNDGNFEYSTSGSKKKSGQNSGNLAAADYRCGLPGCSKIGQTGYGKSVDDYINKTMPHHAPVPSVTVWDVVAWAALPELDEWRACAKNPGLNSHCAWAATDIPMAKALKGLKLLKGSKVKKADDAVDGVTCTRCFLAGTDVLMASGATKDIEDVEVGDQVLATDPKTGETGPRQVTRLIITEDDKHFNKLSIATTDGIEQLTATHEHPFWSPSEHDWIAAGKLTAGMTLRTDTGATVIVTSNRAFTRHARTYNLTVDDLHTYYVLAGETPVLVHNSGPGCGSIWIDSNRIPHHFKHAKDFGIAGKESKATKDAFVRELQRFVGDPNNVQIHGTWRNSTPARHYVNLRTGQHVSVDLESGKLLGAWRTDVNDDQFWHLTMFGKL
ncbi:polymorphic toxin-type HINT domain-containing protein [Streptomyces cellulosae]